MTRECFRRHDAPARRAALRAAARACAAAGLLLLATAASASDLTKAIDRLVVQGFEDPQGADAGLRALQAATPATPDNTRALLVGFGLVAADNYMPSEVADTRRPCARWPPRPARLPRPTRT